MDALSVLKSVEIYRDEEAAGRRNDLEHRRMKIRVPTKKTAPYPSMTASG